MRNGRAEQSRPRTKASIASVGELARSLARRWENIYTFRIFNTPGICVPLMASRRLRASRGSAGGNLQRFALPRKARPERPAAAYSPGSSHGRERNGEKREGRERRNRERRRSRRTERVWILFGRSIGSTYGSERARPGMPAGRPGAVYTSARSIDAIDRPYFRRTSSPTRAPI